MHSAPLLYSTLMGGGAFLIAKGFGKARHREATVEERERVFPPL